MKSATVELKFEGYWNEAGEQLWAKVPRSIREGKLNEIATLPKTDKGRSAYLATLDLVSAWNFDDSTGNALPLPRTIHLESFTTDAESARPDGDMEWQPTSADQKWREARFAVLEQIDLEILLTISSAILERGTKVNERAEGF